MDQLPPWWIHYLGIVNQKFLLVEEKIVLFAFGQLVESIIQLWHSMGMRNQFHCYLPLSSFSYLFRNLIFRQLLYALCQLILVSLCLYKVIMLTKTSCFIGPLYYFLYISFFKISVHTLQHIYWTNQMIQINEWPWAVSVGSKLHGSLKFSYFRQCHLVVSKTWILNK